MYYRLSGDWGRNVIAELGGGSLSRPSEKKVLNRAMAQERAASTTDGYRSAVESVRTTISGHVDLREEDWSSLTNHITELFIMDYFGYLKCRSADSVVDGIIPEDGQTEVHFEDRDREFLMRRGIQVKGRRHARGSYGTTGDVKLSSPFKYLYIVWVNESYEVERNEVYRIDYAQVAALQAQKHNEKPRGKNNLKISRREAQEIGVRVFDNLSAR